MTDCVFCPDNWDNLDIIQDTTILRVEGQCRVAILNPLNPVTDGHVLVISSEHSDNAAEHPGIARDLMQIAAQYVADHPAMQANIITSVGEHATQTVKHTHVHVVPRRPDDGLPLPWTPQQQRRETPARNWEPSLRCVWCHATVFYHYSCFHCPTHGALPPNDIESTRDAR